MSTPDFQTQLRVQLRDAARRDERRGPLARARYRLPAMSPALAVAAVVTLIVLLAAFLGVALRSPDPDRSAEPKAVEHFSKTDSLGPILAAFGSVWAVDPNGQLLELDPATRDVLNSFDIPAGSNLGVWAGSLWVNEGQDYLLRLDPKTGRRLARIPSRTPAGDQFISYDVALAVPYAWFIGIDGLLRVDMRRNAVDRFIALDTSGLSKGGLVQGNTLYVLARNNRLLRFDARTGARRGSIPVSWPAAAGMAQQNGVAVTSAVMSGRIARVDVTTGRELWAQDLRATIGAWTAAGPDVWVHVAPSSGRGKDQLVRLNARTGRVISKTVLPDFGVTSIAAVNPREVWVGTPGGQIDVVRVAKR
jgi:outer membrane protein assembly factor BamB